jgi:hypothetical protein
METKMVLVFTYCFRPFPTLAGGGSGGGLWPVACGSGVGLSSLLLRFLHASMHGRLVDHSTTIWGYVEPPVEPEHAVERNSTDILPLRTYSTKIIDAADRRPAVVLQSSLDHHRYRHMHATLLLGCLVRNRYQFKENYTTQYSCIHRRLMHGAYTCPRPICLSRSMPASTPNKARTSSSLLNV